MSQSHTDLESAPLQLTQPLDRPTLSVMDGLSVQDEGVGPLFPMAFRGYDRDEVERHLHELESQLLRLTETRNLLASELEAARDALVVATAAEREAGHPSYKQMGERIAQIFTLAEQEATALRDRSETDLTQARLTAEEIIAQARREGDELITLSRRAAAEIDADRRARLAAVESEIAAAREAAKSEISIARTAADTEIRAAREAAAAEASARKAAIDAEVAAGQMRRDEVAAELQALIGRITAAGA